MGVYYDSSPAAGEDDWLGFQFVFGKGENESVRVFRICAWRESACLISFYVFIDIYQFIFSLAVSI